MIINGKAFEGTFDYEYTDSRVKLCAGTSCIIEFKPIEFPSAEIIYKLLHALYKWHLCLFNWNVCFVCRGETRFL